MDKRILLVLFLLSGLINSYGKNKLDSLLMVLDRTLDDYAIYDQQKEERINRLRSQLGEVSVINEDAHQVYANLYREYEAYVFDSAMYYVKLHLEISEKEHNKKWINDCKMQLARMYSNFAKFPEAIDLLNSIEKKELSESQLGYFYNRYAEIYIYWGEYSNNADASKYKELRDVYQDSALLILPQGTYDYNMNYARKCIEARNFGEAEKILLPYIPGMAKNTRDYAILTSLISYLYELKGVPELQGEYLAMSAIADLEASVKENTSMGYLAYFLLYDKQVDRANRYIKKSLVDANFYNARLRNIQVSKILPVIDKAYQLQREQYQKNLKIALVAIGILLMFVTCLVFYLIKQMNKLAKTRKEVLNANKELKKTNTYLAETSHIKEEYIGLFLNQCSIYIDKLENYRKSLNKKAATGRWKNYSKC